jgi:hypothetical protein
MLSGFNTNLRHRGVLFHVQTEDSGRAKPHIISHLFHGGNILASRKTEYAAMLDSEVLSDKVREMMETQHKEMLRGLIRGAFDAPILERMGPDAFGDAIAETESCLDTAEDDLLEAEVEEILAEELPGEPILAEPIPAEPLVEDSKERIARVFGDGVVSERPLDEVVLDYLVESARKRKRPGS